jgi:hypothetical protein
MAKPWARWCADLSKETDAELASNPFVDETFQAQFDNTSDKSRRAFLVHLAYLTALLLIKEDAYESGEQAAKSQA